MRLILSKSQINPLLNELMINRKLVFFEYVHFECLVSFFNLKFGRWNRYSMTLENEAFFFLNVKMNPLEVKVNWYLNLDF